MIVLTRVSFESFTSSSTSKPTPVHVRRVSRMSASAQHAMQDVAWHGRSPCPPLVLKHLTHLVSGWQRGLQTGTIPVQSEGSGFRV